MYSSPIHWGSELNRKSRAGQEAVLDLEDR